MADSLRERVARAIADVDCCAFDDPVPSEKAFKGCGKWDECMCRKEADAAIELIREEAAKVAENWECLGEKHDDIATAIRNLGKE